MTASDTTALLVYCTCPDDETASRIAAALVDRRLAACVTRLPGAVATYRWQGKIEQDTETLLMIKTSAARYEALEKMLSGMHPYELPEILAVPVAKGLPAYLAWLTESTAS